MKAGILSFCALSLLELAAAQPHRRRHAHGHAKRDMVVETVYVTATAPQVVVYVDANGNPIGTSGQAAPTPVIPAAQPPPVAPTPPAAAPPQVAPPVTPPLPSAAPPQIAPPQATQPAAPAPTNNQAPPPAPVAPTQPQAPAAPPAAPSAQSSSGFDHGFISQGQESGPTLDASDGFGISYSPYVRDAKTQAVRCKTAEEIDNDFEQLTGYDFVRIYGTDCDQTPDVLEAAQSRDMKLMVGIYKVQDASSEVKKIIDAVEGSGGSWDSIVTVGVGNEDIQFGRATVSEVVKAVQISKDSLKAAGYNGPVVHVDTVSATTSNPELCKVSDFAAVNCHAFFDGNVDAAGAGDFVQAQTELVRDACPGKQVRVVESGWPHGGEPNKKAIPSNENQKIAMDSLKANFKGKGFVLFSAFDDKWKLDAPDTFGTEKFWGMLGH